jgi:hypothetical protein
LRYTAGSGLRTDRCRTRSRQNTAASDKHIRRCSASSDTAIHRNHHSLSCQLDSVSIPEASLFLTFEQRGLSTQLLQWYATLRYRSSLQLIVHQSNRPHSYLEQAEAQLSDVRSQTPTAGPSSSALGRRNATRTSRRNEAHRSWETSRARIRRIQNLVRVGHEPSPSATPSDEERSAKRRRLERSGQVEMEQLSMELRYCDGGRYDSGHHLHPYPRNLFTPECALLDDDSGMCTFMICRLHMLIFQSVLHQKFSLQHDPKACRWTLFLAATACYTRAGGRLHITVSSSPQSTWG